MSVSDKRVGGFTDSPAQMYALIVGFVLVIVGIIGFFYESSFTTDEAVRDDVFGIFAVNGWHNLVHIITGVLGLLAAASLVYSRTYALAFGVIYTGLAIWGFIIGSGDSILTIVPVNTADNILHLALGLLGVVAYYVTRPEMSMRPGAVAH